MLDSNEPRTIDETYQESAMASSLRVNGDETIQTPGDMTAAAGMNRHRTGLTFLRLASEWASAAKPIPPTAAGIEALSRSYVVEGDTTHARVPMTEGQIAQAIADMGLDPERLKGKNWTASIEVPNPRKGLVKVDVGPNEFAYVRPLKLAHKTAEAWYQHELGVLMMSLKSLPAARDAILARSRAEVWDCDEHVVAKVLLWWLDPKCEKCGGRNEIVKLRGKDVGKACGACKGTGLERQGEPPHGARGKKISSHIRACLSDARRELREGLYRLRRTDAGKKHRGETDANVPHPEK